MKNKTLKLLIAVAVAGIIFAFVCLFMTLNPKLDFQESYDGKLRLFKLADTSGRTNLLIVRESTGDHMSYAIPFTLRDIACYGWLEDETYDFYLGSADAGAYIFHTILNRGNGCHTIFFRMKIQTSITWWILCCARV